jgi:hypothetical protein
MEYISSLTKSSISTDHLDLACARPDLNPVLSEILFGPLYQLRYMIDADDFRIRRQMMENRCD